MAEATDGDDALIKWHSEGRSVMDTGSAANDAQLEMTAQDENINTSGIVVNDQPFMFISNTSELQQSLGSGVFAVESVADGALAEQRNSEIVSAENDSQRFEGNIMDSGGPRPVKQEASSANAAELSVDSSAQHSNVHPLGSSQNPIRIIQQGNKYTSMQELSPEQLNQIMQVHLSTFPEMYYIYFYVFIYRLNY